MFGRDSKQKLRPALANELSAPCLSGNADGMVQVVAICSRGGLLTLKRNHDVQCGSDSLAFAALTLRRQDVLSLSRDRGVFLLEKDERYVSVPTPLAAYGPRNADVYARYKVGPLRDLDGEGIKIMVQDSGFSPHPDIPQSVRAIDCTDEGTARDYHGHGTAIVSQMLATGPYPGLVPRAAVTMARIFDKEMFTTLPRILRACAIAIEDRVNVVSMSYGGHAPNIVISLAMRKLHSAGVFLVAAAGNSGPANGTIDYLGGYDSVLSVAAVDKQGKLAPFSSRGRPGQKPMKPDIALEGVNIVMAKSPDGHMGTPVDSGYVVASGGLDRNVAKCQHLAWRYGRLGRSAEAERTGIRWP